VPSSTPSPYDTKILGLVWNPDTETPSRRDEQEWSYHRASPRVHDDCFGEVQVYDFNRVYSLHCTREMGSNERRSGLAFGNPASMLRYRMTLADVRL
jgi:hypothetical protein